jgi:phage shock protein A
MQRAQDKVESMQARAGALDELLSSGALTDLNGSRDDIQAQLDKVGNQSNVDAQLAALKQELATPVAGELTGPSGSPTASEPPTSGESA